jgi:hypothetical protein
MERVLRWCWFVLAAASVGGLAWMTRYDHISFRSEDGTLSETVWDRWQHRVCVLGIGNRKLVRICWDGKRHWRTVR